MFTTNAEFNGLSSAIYRNRTLQSQLKILAKIQLSVICAHVVDSCRPGHNFDRTMADINCHIPYSGLISRGEIFVDWIVAKNFSRIYFQGL